MNFVVTQDPRDHKPGHRRIQKRPVQFLNQLNHMDLYPKVQTNRLLITIGYIMRMLY